MRNKLLKSESDIGCSYLYDNYQPARAGKVWDYNGKKAEHEDNSSQTRRKDNLINSGQNIITKGRYVGRENLVKTIQNKREIGLIKMMLENKKNVIAQMEMSQKEREEGLYESEKLLEQDLKKFMDCFQNLKTNKQKEKERNKNLHDEYEKLRKE